MLNETEIHALRYYEGIIDEKDTDVFWQDIKAYVTFNSLFFTGLETEIARSTEQRRLNTAIALERQQLLPFVTALFSACTKYRHGLLHVYRVERLVDYRKFCECGQVTSFLSTSRNGFLKSYEDKFGLVLMDMEIAPETLCVDLVEMIPGKKKEEECEVLIAPYSTMQVKELPLPQELAWITDGNGNSAAVYCHVKVKKGKIQEQSSHLLFTKEEEDAVKNVYTALNMHAVPSKKDTDRYLRYKTILQAQMQNAFMATQKSIEQIDLHLFGKDSEKSSK